MAMGFLSRSTSLGLLAIVHLDATKPYSGTLCTANKREADSVPSHSSEQLLCELGMKGCKRIQKN
jgi:hypothetical protein